MNNIEYTRHNTETKKIKTKYRKQNRQSRMDNIEYTRHNTETKKIKIKHRKQIGNNHEWTTLGTQDKIRRQTNKNKTHRKLKK